MGPAVRGWSHALMVTGAVVALDQTTKALVRAHILLGDSEKFFLGVDLTYVRNKGVAFGAFSEGGWPIAVLTTGALALLFLYFAFHVSRPWLWLPVGLLLGGALGNLADRARDGAVIDFIDPIAWPAFNLADASVIAGVLSFLYVVETIGTPAEAPHSRPGERSEEPAPCQVEPPPTERPQP
jgi:signal peptidase II